MSILERRQKPDMNRQIIQYTLEKQILLNLRMMKGRKTGCCDVEVQTDHFKFLPIDVNEEIDYDNLDYKNKELYAVTHMVLPPRAKSNLGSDGEEEVALSKKKRKGKKRKIRKKLVTGQSFLSSASGTMIAPGTMTRAGSNLMDILENQDDEFEYEEEEEESESEFEKSEIAYTENNIKILVTDDKDTKKRKLRETYLRLARQASSIKQFEEFDLDPKNSGPSPDNPLIEVLELDLSLTDKVSPMPEGTLFKTVENVLDERLFKEREWRSLGKPTNQPINLFFYNQMMMNYGLKKLALKNIQSLCLGLNVLSKRNHPYAIMISRMLGLQYPLEHDEINVLLRGRIIFNEAQGNESNLNCKNIFILLDLLSKALDKEASLRIIPKIIPSVLNQPMKKETRFKMMVEFSLMKICLKMNKLGKDVRGMFDALDINGDQILDPLEIINGLKNRFGIYFSDEEMANMLQFIDSDFSGDIDFKEFSAKITMGNTILNKLSQNFNADPKKEKNSLFIINKYDFLNTLLKEYKMRKVRELEKIGRDFDRLDKKKRGNLSLKHLKMYINEDPHLTQEYIDEFIAGSDDDLKMNKEQFTSWVYQNNIYGYGKEYFGNYIFGPAYKTLKIVQKKDNLWKAK